MHSLTPFSAFYVNRENVVVYFRNCIPRLLPLTSHLFNRCGVHLYKSHHFATMATIKLTVKLAHRLHSHPFLDVVDFTSELILRKSKRKILSRYSK